MIRQVFKNLAIATIMVSLVACVSAEKSGDCSVGKVCTVFGKAMILPYSDAQEAWLEMDNGCVALALPPDTYDAFINRWNGRQVKIVGIAYLQPKETYLFYDIDGRRVNGGACKGKFVIVANEIFGFPGN